MSYRLCKFNAHEKAPVQTLNQATDNALNRATTLFDVPVTEIMNRATITGSIEIGRNPGVVTATFLAPKKYLEKAGILTTVEKQYFEQSDC